MLQQIKQDLENLATPERAKASVWYFKTGKGQYGEGDVFIGVTVPDQRKVARKYKDLALPEIEKLLQSPIHEHRLTALFILVGQFQRAVKVNDSKKQQEIYKLYLKNARRCNNWDLVDSSAPYISGGYLFTHQQESSVLKRLAVSKNLWERRIAMMSTSAFINQKQYDLALEIARILLHDKHDLIHKAVGWMLREIGNRDSVVEEEFLLKYLPNIPRTTLRYAIEKFPVEKKQFYLKKIKIQRSKGKI